MARLHLKYRNIRPGVVQATRDLLSERPSQLNENEQARLAQVLADEICGEYVVDAPIVIVPSRWASAGWEYERAQTDSLGEQISPARISLRSFSVFTLLSGIARHLNEERHFQFVPRAFAASTFYLAAPSTFRKAVRFGRVAGTTAEETFSTETWERLQELGLTANRGFRPGVTPEILQSAINGTYEPPVDEYEDDDFQADYANAEQAHEESEIEDQELEALFGNDFDDDEPVAIVPDEELEAVVALPEDGLEALNRDGLRKLAADLNIPGRGRMLAPELRTAIREAQTV